MGKENYLNRLYGYTHKHHGKLWFSISSSVFNKILDLMPPILVGWVVDVVDRRPPLWMEEVLGNAEPLTMAGFVAALGFIIFGFESLFQWMYQWGFMSLAQDVQHELRCDTYAHIQKRETQFFDDHRLGDTMTILNDDVNQLERFLNNGLNTFIQLAVLFIFSGAVLFAYNYEMALLAVIPIPLVIWGSLYYQKIISPRYTDVRTAAGFLNARLENNISGIRVVKSFTAEDLEAERVARASAHYRDSNYQAIKLRALYVPLIRMIIAVGFAGILFLGSYFILGGFDVLKKGELTVFAMMVQRMLWPLTGLGTTLDDYERAKASANRVFGLLDSKSTIKDPVEPKALPNEAASITFDDVDFSYRNIPVIQKMNMTVEAGHTVGFAGTTGAGKTTLIKLLMRMYDVDFGSIRIGGIDVRECTLADLRSKIALVSQDVYLFHGSIYENIVYGRPGASEEEVYHAARTARLHDFIIDLPDGYHTLIGERGLKLSGGQRQRLSIARAILKNAPILVLDEATSSVDTETEKEIQKNLLKITAGKTALVIAHRLSTIRRADKIIVLDNGRVAEEGPHEELLEKRGKYAELWDIQIGNTAELGAG